MLFNSYEFLFAFLPLALAGFFFAHKVISRDAAIVWLVLISLFYYGWWNAAYLSLILASMAVNFAVGRGIGRIDPVARRRRRLLLAAGVAFNLGLLGYFKYANFFVDTAASLTGADIALAPIILPLAISFFTFQQIAYLADAYQGLASEFRFRHYALFVTFFPQLIAGPIVHHKEMMPQFMHDALLRPRARNFAVGGTILAIGLFKKVVLADGIAPYASPVFAAAAEGETLGFLEAWAAHSPTHFSSTLTSPDTRTWRSAARASSASGCLSTSSHRTRRPTSSSFGGAGTLPCLGSCATISTSRSVATGAANRAVMPTC